MAVVKFMSLVTDVRKRMDDVVFSNWKGRAYVKKYVSPTEPNSANQLQVRDAFKALTEDWRYIQGAIKNSWDNFVKDECKTGYNAFIGENSVKQRAGELLTLSKMFGVMPLRSFSAATGTNSGEIDCAFQKLDGQPVGFITVFAQKITDGIAGGEIKVFNAGNTDTTAFTVTGLDEGADYHLYAVVTEAVYASAALASESKGASARAFALIP